MYLFVCCCTDKPSVEVADASETRQHRLCKQKVELNSLISNGSSTSNCNQPVHQEGKLIY